MCLCPCISVFLSLLLFLNPCPSPLSLCLLSERERESAQARKCFMLENIYLTQKKALMKTQGSKKSTRHTEKNNKVTYETLAYQ